MDAPPIFAIYNHAKDVPPGRGDYEWIDPLQIPDYIPLIYTANWRRRLSDANECMIFYRSLTFSSVIHALYAERAYEKDRGHLEFHESEAQKYSIEYGSNYAFRPACNLPIRAPAEDEEIWYLEILRAKFQQHPDLAKILLDTHDAEIRAYAPNAPLVRLTSLMTVREELQASAASSE